MRALPGTRKKMVLFDDKSEKTFDKLFRVFYYEIVKPMKFIGIKAEVLV